MKFNVIFSTDNDRFERAVEGDLDTVKTYIKLTAGDNFKWGAVIRLNELSPGDVSRWLIQKNRTTGDISLNAFSFFSVDPEININAMISSFNHKDDSNIKELHKVLGGGVI